MATYYTRPSFTSNVPTSAKNYEMEYSSGKYAITLTDTNNVLSKYRVTSNNGVSVSLSPVAHGGPVIQGAPCLKARNRY